MTGPDLDFVLSYGNSGFIEHQRTGRVTTLIDYQCPLAIVGISSHHRCRCWQGIPR